jgi:hypothetical protein
MSVSICSNCGAPLNSSKNNRFVVCDYCTTANSNFSTFEDYSIVKKAKSKLPDEINDIMIAYKLKEYDDVKRLCLKILDSDPHEWMALTYLAISSFWLGKDDYSHLDDVKKKIDKAMMLSENNEFVFDASSKIANHIIAFCIKNKVYGEDFKIAITAFGQARELCELEQESLETINKYCITAYEYQMKKLEDIASKAKSDYDPPYVSIDNIGSIVDFTKDTIILENYYLHGMLHYEKNKTKSYASSLLTKLLGIEEVLRSKGSLIPGKRITFTMFGKIKVL